ncbi:MAG: molybdopterin-dependent oxidoreductase [Gammaproteobacteria bacterium]|nr:molybdopterin-dependent oxidoreductase [Gammaproteobacteria bacterium]
MTQTANRRRFMLGSGAAALSLKYAGTASAQEDAGQAYVAWEDLMREKWTWDRVAHGSHGTNCQGGCAFNLYVKNGIVWREEQQGEYGQSDPDAPDYGPRGCQKGLRHAKYMYGNQRVLYPMKRVGERGEGKWERISWDQALADIADRFIDTCSEHGAESITMGLGTQMAMKRASLMGLLRFATISGSPLPEAFAGVGDLPTGIYLTIGEALVGDTAAAIFKSKACLIWFANPAVTRIPDAHFFWEARYNGTEVIAISPEFTPTAMHASKWVNPKPGTDGALALGMAHTIIDDGSYDADYIREQTDLPFLVRTDNRRFLRAADFGETVDDDDQRFYFWDSATDTVVPAPGTGFNIPPPGQPIPEHEERLTLGEVQPALEGRWTIETPTGPVEVTTVFELLKDHLRGYSPERASDITGVHPDVIRDTARVFASARPAMIYTGFRVSKWLHGDLLQRSLMLLLSITGNLGKPGGGMQFMNLARDQDQLAFTFDGLPPTLRVATLSRWDYVHANGKELNREVYGDQVAEHFDQYFQQSVQNRWFPDYSHTQWKMGFYMGSNAANWRASGKRWRREAFEQLEHIVACATDMGVTSMYADYVLPVAHHYERQDIVMWQWTPYLQVLDAAVPPLGEAVDDFELFVRLTRAISERAKARNIPPVEDNYFGMPVTRDFAQFHDMFTKNGAYTSMRDALDFQLAVNPGFPKESFDTLADNGITRVPDSDGIVFGPNSPYRDTMIRSVNDKKPYHTMTGRQQYYIDHDWFLQEGEALPTHREPLGDDSAPLRLVMGHARHGIHSMWRDDPLLVGLQRGEPDIFVNPDDAAARDVADGDLIRVFNTYGSFIAMAHVSAGMQPGMTYMYHGWDPMMFRGRQNFGAVTSGAGLIKPTAIAGGQGHVNFRTFQFEPNAVFQDVTCNFEKHVEA